MSPKAKADHNMAKALEEIAECEAIWTAEMAKELEKQGLDIAETVGFQGGQLPGTLPQGSVPPQYLAPGSWSTGRGASPVSVTFVF